MSNKNLLCVEDNADNKKLTDVNIQIEEKPKSQEELMKQTDGYKLYLIVPYRDNNNGERKKQLVQFIPHMNKYLKALKINYEIIVVEQDDDELFNRGLLFNFGVKYINQKELNINKIFLCFHDVDIIPIEETNYYKPDNNMVNHLYGYRFSLGGIILCNFEDYIKINGFSNMYCGWGYEDNDLQRRVSSKNLNINRNFFCERHDEYCFKELDLDKYSSLKKMSEKGTKINQKIFEENNNSTLDGINKLNDFEKYINIQKTLITDPKDNNEYEFNMIKCQVTSCFKAMPSAYSLRSAHLR